MRQRIALAFGLILVATLGGVATYRFSVGQPPSTPPTGPIRPAVNLAAASETPARSQPLHDLTRMSAQTRKIFLSARSGTEWLMRMDNSINGRFMPGWLPAVNLPAESDSYLHQAGATYALAKAARYFGDERYLMKARQAILSLLADTRPDPTDASCRCVSLPAIVVNRLAAAGLLLRAIHELQEPAKDLLDQGEQLAQYIRKQQSPDGSLRVSESGESVSDPQTLVMYPAMALDGLVASQRHRPATWKRDVASKAFPYYRQQWKDKPSLAAAAWLTLACAEQYRQSKDREAAAFVLEMSDWTCSRQHGMDARNPNWIGGFTGEVAGKTAPRIDAALNLEALAQACLLTRQLPDASRYAKYQECLDLGANFLTTLQFSESNTLHFTPAYRTALIGGFHPTHEDGNLRLDENQHAISALTQYLMGSMAN